MTKESSHAARAPRVHRVVVIVDENSNPFELGCATEVFGLRRPEIGRDLYDFRVWSRGAADLATRPICAR